MASTRSSGRARWALSLAPSVAAVVWALPAAAAPAPRPPAPEPAPSLVGHWSFDATDGAKAMDDSDAGRHGELRDGAARSPGMIGTAVSIDGDGAHVHLPQSDLFDGFAAVTVAAWIRAEPGGTGDWSTIIEKASGGKPKHPHVLWIGFRRESRTWAFQIATDRGQNFFQSFRVKVQHGAWTHVAVTIDVATRRAQLFIDGELRRDLAQLKLRGSTLWSNPKGATAIGMIAQGANNFWNGALDEVRIYRGTLPPDTIRVLARAPGKAGASEPEPAPRPN